MRKCSRFPLSCLADHAWCYCRAEGGGMPYKRVIKIISKGDLVAKCMAIFEVLHAPSHYPVIIVTLMWLLCFLTQLQNSSEKDAQMSTEEIEALLESGFLPALV